MKTLKARLSSLSRQAGVGQRASPHDAPSIAQRIQRLRVDDRQRTWRARPDDRSLAELVNGSVVAPGVIGIEQHLPLTSRHGDVVLADLSVPPSHLPEAAGLHPGSAVFLDTETTGLSGGTGTVVFLLGLARVMDAALVVRQYLLTRFSGEPIMLQEAASWIRGTEVLVTYNGKAFDVPLLAARCRLASISDPFRAHHHVDLLHPTRRAYGASWSDCRLATSEQRLLGFVRDHDLPGSEAPDAWFRLLRAGDSSRLPGVVRHNHWDLVSLSALLLALDQAHRQPAASHADLLAIARHHLRSRDEARAYALLSAHQGELDDRGLLELARLQRRQGRWADACPIWEELAGQGCSEALERLAIYHEHIRADYERALEYACRLPAGDDTERRKHRLYAKLARRKKLAAVPPLSGAR